MFIATVNALRDTRRIDLTMPIEPDSVKEREMKQVIQRVVERTTGSALDEDIDDDESAVAFADRFGFTKFMYRYEQDDHQVIVDVMDPSRTDNVSS